MAGPLRQVAAAAAAATKLFVPPSHLNIRRCLPAALVTARCMTSSKLFVGGISFHTDENTLKNAFAAHGEVIEAKIIVDRNTGMSRGFGFVSFNTESEAENALKAMDGQILNGRVVRVDYASMKPLGGGGFARRPNDGYSPAGSRFNQDSGPYPGGLSFQDSSRSFQGGYSDTIPQSTSGLADGISSISGYPRSGSGPLDDRDARNNVGWSEASPPAEDFGPIGAKTVFGPKSLQGGYEYTPGTQVPLNVGPAFATANPGDQRTSIVPNTDFGANISGLPNEIGSASSKSSASFSGGPVDAKNNLGFSDVMGPSYSKSTTGWFSDRFTDAKSSPGLPDGIDTTNPKSSTGFSNGFTDVKSSSAISDDIGPAYSKSSLSNRKTDLGFSDEIGPTYPKSTLGSSGGSINTSSSFGLSGNIGPYSKSSPGFPGGYTDKNSSSGMAYSKSNSGFSSGPANVKSSLGLAKDIGPAYPNEGHSNSFISSGVTSSVDIDPPYPKTANQTVTASSQNTDHPYSNDIRPGYPKSNSGFSGGFSNAKSSVGRSNDVGPTYPNSSLGFSGGPTYPKSNSGFSSGSTDAKNEFGLSDNIGPAYLNSSSVFSGSLRDAKGTPGNIGNAYSKSSLGVSSGPASVKTSHGLSKDIGPEYPNGGYLFNYAFSGDIGSQSGPRTSDDTGPSYFKASTQNGLGSSEDTSDGVSGSSEGGPNYDQGRF